MGKNTVSLRGKILRDIVAEVNTNQLIKNQIKKGELRVESKENPWKCPKQYSLEKIDMTNFSMEWFTPDEPNMDKVILQLHGGGYVGGIKNSYRNFAHLYSKVGKNICVLTPDYRLAPENIFPAALEDAYEAYKWLLEKGYKPDQIILGGDSAGGGLSVVLCMYLREHKLPLPSGIITMSPWTDLTATGSSYEDNFQIDPVFGNTRDSQIFDSAYIGEHDPKNPYISPVFGDFSEFPPILIQVGTHEMLLSDSKDMAKKAIDSNISIQLSIYEGMFHVFQMAGNMLPESKRAWKEVGSFIKRL